MLTRVREFLRDVGSVILTVTGLMGLLVTLSGNGASLINGLGDSWVRVKRSPNSREMASDIGNGIAASVAYLLTEWKIVGLVVLCVFGLVGLRSLLVVRPRQRMRDNFAKGCASRTSEPRQVKTERGDD